MPPLNATEIDVDWAAVRKAHGASDQTVEQILEAYGLTKDQLYRRARAENWPLRHGKGRRRKPLPLEAEDRPATVMEKRAAMAARLFHALEERIMAIEEEALLHDSTHGERDAKALTAMARALDTLGEMLEASDSAGSKGAKTKPDEEEIADDEFRQLLTDRLNRLRERGQGS